MKENELTLDDKKRRIAIHYGYMHQKHKLLEECSELLEAYVKEEKAISDLCEAFPDEMPEAKEKLEAAIKHSEEELADVLIMAKQIDFLLNTSSGLKQLKERIYQTMNEKLDRELERINKKKTKEREIND